jgi:hypothetical protein
MLLAAYCKSMPKVEAMHVQRYLLLEEQQLEEGPCGSAGVVRSLVVCLRHFQQTRGYKYRECKPAHRSSCQHRHSSKAFSQCDC